MLNVGDRNQHVKFGDAPESSMNWQSRQSATPYYQAEFGAEFDMTLGNRFPEDKYFVKNAEQHRRSYFKKV
jgi:hypothetical protein